MADLKINHVTHAKSNKVMEDGKAKLPTPEMLSYGELAINYAKGVETISFKNAENEIVTVSSDEQIKTMIQNAQGTVTELTTNSDEQHIELTKGELNEETNTVTYTIKTVDVASAQALADDELVLAAALTDLNTMKETKVDWVKTNNDASKPERKSIVLDNHDLLLGKGTDGGQYNLAMVSKWDVADFGSTSLHANLNSKDRVTVNDKEQIAYVSDIENLDAMFISALMSGDKSKHIGFNVQQTDGKLTTFSISEQDIASAEELSEVSTKLNALDEEVGQAAIHEIDGVTNEEIVIQPSTGIYRLIDNVNDRIGSYTIDEDGNISNATGIFKGVFDQINMLDATVGSQTVADGKHVAVEVVEADGKLTTLTVTESDIASAKELAELKNIVGTPAVEEEIQPDGTVTPSIKPTGMYSKIKTYSLNKLTDEELTTANLGANVKEAYKLLDSDDAICGDYITVYKDSSLKSVELVSAEAVTLDGNSTPIQTLRYTYILADGSESVVDLDVSTFLQEAEFKHGLEVNEAGEVSVKVDASSDDFLTVSKNGLKLSGIQESINNINIAMSKISGTYTVDDIEFNPVDGDVYHQQATIDEAKYQEIYEAVQDNKIIMYHGIVFSSQIEDDKIVSTYFSAANVGILGSTEMKIEFTRDTANLYTIITPWIAENVNFDPKTVSGLNASLQSTNVQGIIEELATELNDSSFIINRTDLGSTTLYTNLFNAIKSNKIIIFKNGDNLISVSCSINETEIWVSALMPYANEVGDLNLFSNLIVLHEDGTYDIEESSVDLLVSGDGTKYLNDKGEYTIVKSSEVKLADNTTHITLASSTDENGVVTYTIGENDIASAIEIDTKVSESVGKYIGNIKLYKLTQAEYDALEASDALDADTLYVISEDNTIEA